MAILKNLKFILFSKGIFRAVGRIMSISKRFGLSPKKQVNCIKHYASILKEYDAKATFFIPAAILNRHADSIRSVDCRHIEWGIHGYVHTDMSRLSKEDKLEQVRRAVEIFEYNHIKFSGFRAPYLRPNVNTMLVLEESGKFLYDSSEVILWDEAYGRNERYYKWINKFCSPELHSQVASMPALEGGIIEVPVSFPDDEVLVDRERLSADSVLAFWRRILKRAHEADELFVLQLHPERINELSDALHGLLFEAKTMDPPVWITSLSEVAKWHKDNIGKRTRWPSQYKGAICITGDIDCLTIKDYFLRLIEW